MWKNYLKITCGDKKDCNFAKTFDKIFLNICSQNLDIFTALKNKSIVDLSELEKRSFSKLKKHLWENCHHIFAIFSPFDFERMSLDSWVLF